MVSLPPTSEDAVGDSESDSVDTTNNFNALSSMQSQYSGSSDREQAQECDS